MIYTDNKDYYPTPKSLASKMWHMISKKERNKLYFILEPQAGTGHLIDALRDLGDEYRQKICAIEKDERFCAVLRGKNIRVIANDFLTFDGPDKFDLIFMNPPFSNGEYHLLKAIDIMYSGHIVCVLNSSTIKNPCNNLRTHLVKLLKEYGANIEYHQSEFVAAERKTSVEVALVHIHIKRKVEEDLFEGITDAPRSVYVEDIEGEKAITEKESVRNLVADYNERVGIGTQTLMDYYRNHHKIGRWINIKTDEEDRGYFENTDLTSLMKFKLNNFVKDIRKTYWEKALELDAVRKRMTAKRADEFYQRLKDNEYMDFTENNVRTFILNLINSYESILMKAVEEIFEKMTHKYCWDEDLHNGNVHYFNGWKTNKAFYVNNKVILPCYGWLGGPFWDVSWKKWNLDFRVEGELRDIDIVMNYFDGMSHYYSMAEALKKSFESDKSRNIKSTYFKMSVFKKGTIHLTFKNEDIRRRFNVTACKGRGWLPQDYGVKPYAQLSHQMQEIVSSFEGEESYTKNLSPDRTLFKMKDLLQIDYQEPVEEQAQEAA